MKRLLSLLATTSLLLGLAPLKASAVTGSDWDKGRIISDFVFTDNGSMSISQIQAFLNAKVPVCDKNRPSSNPNYQPPYTCLKDYQENTATGASNYGKYNSDGTPKSVSGGKSAARIIWEEAQEYSISPKVLLTMLQKEQSLVTDDWPWLIQYQKAMGQACPDTAPCDPDFAGFYNQVSGAAWQLRHYINNPQYFNYRANVTRFVLYNPNSNCGGTNIYLENAATAALYNYTPYQPNQAALDNLYGTGNNCSAYGNRNFWRLFSDWFGSTLKDPYPGEAIVGDWNGNGTETASIKRGNEYVINNDNTGSEDDTFGIGRVMDKVITGDWDGDGKDEVGLRRGAHYYLLNDAGAVAYSFDYGKATDGAFIGDWDGDGVDEIGLKRGTNYYLNYDHNSTADKKIAIGRDSDQVIVGNWDGDEADEIGLRRGAYFYLDTDDDGKAEASFGIGRVTDEAFIGDWDGDGVDGIGLKRGSLYYLDEDNDGTADTYIAIGRDSDQVIVGNWDGDEADEIGLKRNNIFYYDTDHDGNAEISFVLGYY